MPPRSRYARLLALPGALAFTVPNLFARLPGGMFGVANVIMITSRHDSYALAGAVAATSLAASALAGPLVARAVDRRGQRRVAVPAAALSAAGHLALALCVGLGAPVWAYFCCALAAATTPNSGGMSRARWAYLLGDDAAARHTANSLEQALDELCYLSGPVLAAVLCTAVAPQAGTVTAAVLMLGGTLVFAAQRATEPPPVPRAAGAATAPAPLRSPSMAALLVTFVCTGAVFGAMEVVTVAFADENGQQGWAGPVLAAQAAGSAVAGLLFGLVPVRGRIRTRFAVCASAMAVLMCLPPLVAQGGSLLWLAPALLVAGAATAPTMVTGMTLVQDVTPPARLNEGMTLAVTALLGGISLGSAGGGWLVDHLAAGPRGAYALPAGAALLAAGLALAAAARRSNGEPRPEDPDRGSSRRLANT
jgi:MFS family permease